MPRTGWSDTSARRKRGLLMKALTGLSGLSALSKGGVVQVGPRSAGAAAGDGWAGPENVVASDDQYATYDLAMGETSTPLAVTAFGFALPAGVADLIGLHRGEDVDLEFQLTPPSDCTGWTITLKVAPTLAGTVSVTKSATIVDGPRGRFRVSLASADTSSLAVGRHVWDVRRTDS